MHHEIEILNQTWRLNNTLDVHCGTKELDDALILNCAT